MGVEVDRLEVIVESQASAANKELDRLIKNLNEVATAMTGIKVPAGFGTQSKSFSNGMSVFAVGANRSNSSLKKLTSSLASYTARLYGATGRTKSLSSTFGSFYASFFPIIRGFKALGRAVESSMDYIETFNYFNVTMDKIGSEFSDQYDKFGYDSAEAYADSFSSRLNNLTKKMTGYEVGDNGMLSASSDMSLGLDPNAIMNYQASIGAITNSVGLIGETSVNTSKALTMLASDMSSFKNVDLSTVMTNMQSGLIGQSRALYKYGIDITNATLQTYAYKYGLNTAVSEMTQADKMQLRLLAILDQSRVAWGDQANTINSVANQYRILKQQISNVARTIGNILIPIAQAVLPVLNGVMMALGRMFSFIGPIIYGAEKWQGIMDGISSGYSGIDTGNLVGDTDDLADSTGNVGSNLDDASTAAKKLQRTILGFDQINKLNDNSSSDTSSGSGSSGSGGSGGIDLSNEIGAALADYESVWNKAFENSVNQAQAYANKICAVFNNMWNMLKAGDYEGLGEYIAGGVNSVFEKINSVFNWEKTGPTITAFMDGYTRTINSLVDNIEWENIGKTFGDGLNVITNTLYLWYSGIDWVNIGTSIAEGLNGLVDSIDWLILGRTIGAWIMRIPKIIYGFVTELKWDEIGIGIGNAINGIFLEFDGKIIAGGINGFVNGIITTIKSIIGTVKWGEVVKAIGDVLGNLDWGALAAVGLTIGAFKLAGVFVGLLGDGIAKAMTDMMANGAGKMLSGIGKKIGDLFVVELGNGVTVTGLQAIVTRITSAFSGISLPTAGILGGIAIITLGIIDLWKTSETFRENVKKMLGIIGDAFSDFKRKAWDEGLKPLWDSVAELFGSLYGIYESSGLKKIFEAIVTGIGYLASTALAGFIQYVANFVKEIANKIQFVVDVLKKLLEFVQGFLDDHKVIIDKIKGLWSGLTEFLGSVFSIDMEKILGKVVGFAIDFYNKHKETIDKVCSVFSGFAEFLHNIFSLSVKDVLDRAKQLFVDTANKISGAFSGIGGTIKKAFSGALDGIKNVWNNFASWINRKLTINIDTSSIIGKGISSVIGTNRIKLANIPTFAQGGFPNTGEMFMARENGITEMVGRIGSRTAVANNDQIVESIASGVRDAIVDAVASVAIALNGGNNENVAPVIENTIKIDSETLFKLTQKGEQKANRRYQTFVQVT